MQRTASKNIQTEVANRYGTSQLGIAHDVFTQNRKMSATQFQNIVNAACKAKQFSWIKVFISGQRDLLDLGIREDAELLADTMVAFENKTLNG